MPFGQKAAQLTHPDLKFLFPVTGEEGRLDEAVAATLQAMREDPCFVFQYDKAASIRLALTRELLRELAYKPYEAERRVVVVRDADRMREDQYSALLKSLEEPGASTVWVLTTSRPARLPEAGIRCVSMLARQHPPEIAPGVALISANVDLVRWSDAPGFVGAPEAARRLLGALRARRLGLADGTTPIGLLTHHWALDADAGRFMEALGRLVNDHPAACWICPPWPATPAA